MYRIHLSILKGFTVFLTFSVLCIALKIILKGIGYIIECPNEKRILEFQLESVIFLCGEVIEGHMQNLRSLASEMANHTASKVY